MEAATYKETYCYRRFRQPSGRDAIIQILDLCEGAEMRQAMLMIWYLACHNKGKNAKAPPVQRLKDPRDRKCLRVLGWYKIAEIEEVVAECLVPASNDTSMPIEDARAAIQESTLYMAIEKSPRKATTDFLGESADFDDRRLAAALGLLAAWAKPPGIDTCVRIYGADAMADLIWMGKTELTAAAGSMLKLRHCGHDLRNDLRRLLGDLGGEELV